MPIEPTPPPPPRQFTSNSLPLFSSAAHELLESQQVEQEYRQDIIGHMNFMEEYTRCDPEMMATQPELQWHMRPYLLDFLVESHLGLQLSQETLFLAVNIVDRYSSKRVVFKRHYQLVGCSALWIASKYQDKKNKVPTLQELKLICCNAYEPHMFTQMELHILVTLNWTIGHPTVDLYVDLCFGEIKPQDAACAESVRNIALYLCENSMYCREMIPFVPSVIAKSAFKLGLLFLTMGNMPFKPGDQEEALCLELMSRACSHPTACLERKYSRPEYSSAMRYIREYTEAAAAAHEEQLQEQLLQQLQEQQPQPQHRNEEQEWTYRMTTPAPTPARMYSETHISIKQEPPIEQPPQQESAGAGYMTPPVSPEKQVSQPDFGIACELPWEQQQQQQATEQKPIIHLTTAADMQRGEYAILVKQEDDDDDDFDDDECMNDEDMSTMIYDTNRYVGMVYTLWKQ